MYPKCKLGKVFRLCGWAWAHSVIVRVTVLLTLDKHGRSCLCTRLRPQQNAQRTNNCTFVCEEHLLLSQRSAKSLLKDRTPFLLHCCTTTRAVGRSMWNQSSSLRRLWCLLFHESTNNYSWHNSFRNLLYGKFKQCAHKYCFTVMQHIDDWICQFYVNFILRNI